MKKIVYKVKGYIGAYNSETEENVECLVSVERPYSEVNEEIAKREAYNGEYETYDDDTEEVVEPTQLDIIEAQVTYTAMMTDTLPEE